MGDTIPHHHGGAGFGPGCVSQGTKALTTMTIFILLGNNTQDSQTDQLQASYNKT